MPFWKAWIIAIMWIIVGDGIISDYFNNNVYINFLLVLFCWIVTSVFVKIRYTFK